MDQKTKSRIRRFSKSAEKTFKRRRDDLLQHLYETIGIVETSRTTGWSIQQVYASVKRAA